MALKIALVTIKTGPAPEDSYPPGAPLDLSEEDAAGLKGYVREPTAAELAAFGVGSEPDGDPVDNDDDGDNGGDGGEGGGSGGSDGESRVEQVRAAIDLLDPENDFVKTGARAGKPKIDALADALGFKPDDVEIDAALALVSEGA